MLSKKREMGVLLNISSLKGDYSIGTFGEEVDNFCKFIRSIGGHYWQTLPITSIGFFNSPYSSISAFAGNYLYISPDLMYRDRYIDYDTLQESKYHSQEYTVDYKFARLNKRRVLEIAYANSDYRDVLDEFLIEQGYWLENYAIYMAIKESYNEKPWWEWDKGIKFKDNQEVNKFKLEHIDRFYFYVFEQYIFSKQWKEQLETIHLNGVKIIGDMPLYVAHDSADVWGNKEYFQMDHDLALTNVAGVPPDYFSSEGQLWGNPLYNYVAMKKDGYKWWIERFKRMFELYDILRIDHFRALDEYWSIPSNAKSAKEGKWVDGPKKELLDIINKQFNKDCIIAEDLGTIGDSVRDLLEYSGYPGMRVLHFAFDDFESSHLPHNYPINTIAYTGTHDNNTTLGWVYSLDDKVRDYLFDYTEVDTNEWGIGGYKSKTVKQLIRTLVKSSAQTVIIPYQDLCGYGADTRMNIPGVAESNWEYRLTQESYDNIERDYFLKINNLYGRNNDFDDINGSAK